MPDEDHCKGSVATGRSSTQDERRVLVHELVEEVSLFPDHLEVAVAGAPRLNVTLEEIGVQNCGVRGPTGQRKICKHGAVWRNFWQTKFRLATL